MKQLLAVNGTTGIPVGGRDIPPVKVYSAGELEQLIANIIAVILIVAGVLVVIYLIYGGILYITAGGDAEKAGKGRTAITNAIIGLVIIIASLVIYNYVLRALQVAPLGM